MASAQNLDLVYGEGTSAKVHAAKVLVVGAGGIGCELLKDLALTGFRDITVIDLDTIDVSNLNRQFLFRKQHVGKSKAEIASAAAKAFSPELDIKHFHGNIKDKSFGIDFMRAFAVVLNALDNLSARQHVNRLCLAADVPLVEAGSTGFHGQAYPIHKGLTECYECMPKATPKQYPICTIRSTPEKPVHCIVWAKELHKLVTGDASSSMLFEEDRSASAFMAQAERPAEGSDLRAWATALLDAVFGSEIDKKLAMKENGGEDVYKGARVPPKPIRSVTALSSVTEEELALVGTAGATARLFDPRSQQPMTVAVAAKVLLAAAAEYFADPTERATVGSRSFDKDSLVDHAFVAAASNLRAAIFSIPAESPFSVKSIAGNIIPAIATTNAIIAGLQVVEAVKIVARPTGLSPLDDLVLAPTYHAFSGTTNPRRLLSCNKPDGPRPSCFVCGTARVQVYIDTARATLGTFYDKVLRRKLGFNLPFVDNGEEFLFIAEQEEDEDKEEYEQKMSWMSRPLDQLVGGGIKHGMEVTANDFSQGDVKVILNINHVNSDDMDEEEHPEGFWVAGAVADVHKAAAAAAAAPAAAAGEAVAAVAGDDDDGEIALDDDSDDDLEIVHSDDEEEAAAVPEAAAAGAGQKRSRDATLPAAEQASGPEAKRR